MAMYSRQHYEDVARTLREAKASLLVGCNADTLHAWEHTVLMFSERFMRDNARFKPAKFLAAAGYEETI
jgi:hypothetical protein